MCIQEVKLLKCLELSYLGISPLPLDICLGSLISNPVKPELLLALVSWQHLGTPPSSAWESNQVGLGEVKPDLGRPSSPSCWRVP